MSKVGSDRDSGLLLLIVAIFLFIGGWFIGGEWGTSEQSSVSSPALADKELSKKNALRKLDYDLKDGAIRDEINRAEIQSQNRAADYLDENAALENSEHIESVNPLLFDQENTGQRVLSDTEDARARRRRPQTPEERIAAKLEKDLWSKNYEERQRAEYIKQFLENARKSGVDIRLNENLDVTGIDRFEIEKPIRFPQSESSGVRGGNK